MNYTIVDARPLKGYRLFLRFADGLSGEVNVSRLVGKGVFKAWKKPGFFAKAYIDRETVCWPGDLDLAPDALYERVLKQQKRKLKNKRGNGLRSEYDFHRLQGAVRGKYARRYVARTLKDLANSKFIGMWRDRPDAKGGLAGRLRSKAWKRST